MLSPLSGLLIYTVFALNRNNNDTMAPKKRIPCLFVMHMAHSGHDAGGFPC